MANKNSLSKSSQYVQSLVDFILDTKPYHDKLREVIEEYQFFDDVKVKFTERMLIKAKLDGVWRYEFFSSGSSTFRTLPAMRDVQPLFTSTPYLFGTDENTDLASVPYAYGKKSFDGPGVSDVHVRRGNVAEALVESCDFFQSHGSFQFQVKQTYNANGAFSPTWSATNDNGVIAAAVTTIRENALNVANPQSTVNQVRAIINGIRDTVNSHGGDASVTVALSAIYAILDVPNLPQTYEELFNLIEGNPALAPFVDSDALHDSLENLSSSLFFNQYSDIGLRESGLVHYTSITTNPYLRVTNINQNISATNYEEWTLEAISDSAPIYRLTGSFSGFAGFITAGQTYSDPKFSFNTTFVSQPPMGEKVVLAPSNRLSIHPTAALETWNLIKVNSIAHSRPVLTSLHYGHIQDVFGLIGNITILSITLPTTSLILTATDSTHFSLSSTADSSHTGTAIVGVPYNDGRVAFTIVAGDAPFRAGDRFYIGIRNDPAFAENLDLGFGFDLDSYDNQSLVYSTDPGHPDYNKLINFSYDGRYTDYPLDGLGLTVDQTAIDGRKWRIVAIPDHAREIATLKKDGSGPSAAVDLTSATSGTAPDPASNSVAVYSMPGDSNPASDLILYYATNFRVEFSDNDFATSNLAGIMPIGGSFSAQGITFNLPAPAARPFIGASSDDGIARVEGGDVFSFTIKNPPPELTEKPIGLVSPVVPRLIMHSDSFYEAPAAKWKIEFTTSTIYTVTAVSTGANAGSILATVTAHTPTDGTDTREGFSFKDLGVHFTIVPANGLYAGDYFTFETFAEKPSYLVHGSVSGWKGNATVGKFYWNGAIGFLLTPPDPVVYVANNAVTDSPSRTWPVAGGSFVVSRLREDCPSLTYVLSPSTSGYMVSRSDVGPIGFVAVNGTFSDVYVTFNLTGTGGVEIKLDINAHNYPLWNAQDVVILRPNVLGRLPTAGNKVVVEKQEFGSVAISLTPGQADLTPLKPVAIDPQFIDLNTHQPIPLDFTSPEVAFLGGWLPLYADKFDSSTSIAQFYDPVTRYVFRSAASGQPIGTLKQLSEDLDEPIQFEWDLDFYNTYLPLNAQANIVITNGGWNDKVRTKISETVHFLISGGPLFENFLFHEDIHLHFTDTNLFKIRNVYNTNVTAAIDDTPFDAFIPGYDNLPFDFEDGVDGSYDTGVPPDIYSLLARYDLTPEQRADILSQWNNFLYDGVPPTTGMQWAYLYNALVTNPNPGSVATGFGFPRRGLGIDINANQENHAGVSITEDLQITIVDTTVPQPPVANFTGTPLVGLPPLFVQFTDTSTNNPTSWSWEMYNNGSVQTNLKNPLFIFTVPGTYTIKLTATNAVGSDSETKVNYVTVTAPASQYYTSVLYPYNSTDSLGVNIPTFVDEPGKNSLWGADNLRLDISLRPLDGVIDVIIAYKYIDALDETIQPNNLVMVAGTLTETIHYAQLNQDDTQNYIQPNNLTVLSGVLNVVINYLSYSGIDLTIKPNNLTFLSGSLDAAP